METNKEEIWRPVAGLEHIYEVSDRGRVRRSFNAPAMNATKPGRILSLKPDPGTGYCRVRLHDNGKVVRAQVHRLVAVAFLGVQRNMHVNHIDGNKTNNRIENLEWLTAKGNVLHAWRTGLARARKGSESSQAKLTERDVFVIRSAAARGVLHRILADVFEVNESTITAIVYMQTWKESGLSAAA